MSTLTTAHGEVLHRLGAVDGLVGLAAATAEEAELGLGGRLAAASLDGYRRRVHQNH